MPRNTEDAKGKVKETAGDVTGDEKLEREGKTDQAVGTVKDVAGKAAGAVGDAANSVRDRFDRRGDGK